MAECFFGGINIGICGIFGLQVSIVLMKELIDRMNGVQTGAIVEVQITSMNQ